MKNKNELKNIKRNFLTIVILFFISLTCFSYSLAKENNSKKNNGDKTYFKEKTDKSQNREINELPFTFTVGIQILKGKCLKKQDKIWIEGNLSKKLFEALGAKVSYDSDSRVMALGNIQVNSKQIKLPPVKGTSFNIILNGEILKTGFISKGKKVYISIKSIKAFTDAMNCVMNIDSSANIAALSVNSGAKDPVHIAKSPTVHTTKNPPPYPSPEKPVLISKGDKREAVKKYLDDLKEILNENKPGKGDKKKFEDGIFDSPDKKTISTDYFKEIADKHSKIIEKLNKLTPPDKETMEINRLAISSTAKMKRIIELASVIYSLDDTRANPDAESEMVMLLKQVKNEEEDFNKKVKKIRKKYDLGAP